MPNYQYTQCGHNWQYGSDTTPCVCHNICYECKCALIGTRIDFVRFGNFPGGGKSYNFADNKQEEGASVYFSWQRPRPEFINRNKITGTAVMVGIGSDDEPVIDIDTIKRGMR